MSLKLSGQWKSLKRVVEGGEFKELWYQAKDQKLLVYMLSGNYCPRNCIFSREGRKTEEEGAAVSHARGCAQGFKEVRHFPFPP